MDESLHDALDAIGFLLAVIAAAALAEVAIRHGAIGLAFALLFLIVLALVGTALGVFPDRDDRIDAGDAP